MQETKAPSLYERLGGKPAVSAAVDLFYEKVMADETLRPFFDDVEMERQKGKQRAFLTFAFGGPANYSGKDLRSGHEQQVERGLNEDHFLAVAGHLAATLAELTVPEALIGEVMAIAASTHDDVLGL